MLNVLIICEESQTTCKAFLSLGHNAYSCDLQKCSGGLPERHFQLDCFSLLKAAYATTQSGVVVKLPKWDLVIAHPPCTYLAKSSATSLFPGGVLCDERYKKMLSARDFFLRCLTIDVPHLCVENPTPLKICNLPAPSYVVNPYEFGDDFQKRTCLWVKNLPCLMPTICTINKPPSFTSLHSTGKARSKSFPGMSLQFAIQFGEYIEDKKNNC